MNSSRKEKRVKKIKFIRTKAADTRYELMLFRSNANICVSIFDTVEKKTLTTISTLTKQIREQFSKTIKSSNKLGAELVGKILSEKCIEMKISSTPFVNVASYKYHGRVKSLVESFMSNFKKN